ncbi:MAG: hypothetical protein ACI89D_002348 [Bermanella sp.]|jgi:hypothetical protein
MRWVGENAQYADHWIMRLNSPEYPLAIDEKLAEAGAILFHEKICGRIRLKRQTLLKYVTRGYTGNGSCASCPGAYSSRYVNNPAYLADALLEGVASYVVPINAIGTDRVRFDSYMASSYDYESALAAGEIGGKAEGGFESGVNKGNSEEYIFYAETAGLDEQANTALDPLQQFDSGDCRAQNLDGQQRDHKVNNRALGYAAPPLYGVWATAPYFHNGSVPTVETVLNTAARPAVWQRRSKENSLGEGFVMGFDSSLAAYDAVKMGWAYYLVNYLSAELPCSASDVLLSAAQAVVSHFYDSALLTWSVSNPPVLSNDDVEKRKVYSTSMHSQSNAGHSFSDGLSEPECKAIIEYLETL